jgi:pyroglutamyl-peptidase
VCNDLLYSLLSAFENTETRAAFIHVPYIPEQGKAPSLPLSDIVRALIVAIENLDE